MKYCLDQEYSTFQNIAMDMTNKAIEDQIDYERKRKRIFRKGAQE